MSVILYEYKEFEGVANALVKMPELEQVVMNNPYVVEYNSQQMPESMKFKFDSVVGRLLWYMYVANNVAFSLQYQENVDIFTPEEDAERYTEGEAIDKYLSFFYNIYTNNGTVFLSSDWLNLARDVQTFVLSKKPRGYESGGTIADSTQHFRIMETDTPIYKEGGQIDMDL